MTNKNRRIYESIMKQLSRKVKYLIENIDNDGVFEIDNIKALDISQFNDPMMNTAFNNFNSDHILLNGDKIGINITITDDEDKESEQITLWDDTFGDVLNDLFVISSASFDNNMFYLVNISKVIAAFRKHYMNLLNDDITDDIETKSQEFSKVVAKAKTIGQVAAKIEQFFNI